LGCHGEARFARVGGDADRDHVLNAGGFGAGDDIGAVGFELGQVEMGVGIKELHRYASFDLFVSQPK